MRAITFIFLSILLVPALQGQDPSLPGEEVDVVKQFNARLADVDRVRLAPKLPPLQTEVPQLNYTINSRVLNVQYLPPKIRPIALDRVEQGTIYNGYARLGFGLPKTFSGEASYDFLDNEAFQFGIDLKHLSSNNTEKVENQQFSDTEVLLSSTFFSDQGFSVDADVGYDRNVVHFYGYNDLDDDFDSELSFEKDDVFQRFATIHGKVKVENSEENVAGINYHAGLDFYFMEDNYAARETGFKLDLGASKWFFDEHSVKVDLITDFTTYKDTLDQNLNNFFLEPGYSYHGDRFRAKVGMRLASHDDEFYFYPDLELSVNVVENILTAFAGVEGDLYKNNFRNLTDYNPFLSSRNIVRNSFVTQYYGGIKGEYLGMDYRGQVSYEDVDNLALFLSNRDSIPRFNVLYDTASIITISGEVVFPLMTNLELTGNVAYRIYSLDREDKPWHLPSLTINGRATYTMLDGKLKLYGDVFIENGVPVRNEDGSSKNLNALLDISAGGEYFFTDQIGGFVQVNNIASNKRQRWRHYPMFGLNAVVGVSARF